MRSKFEWRRYRTIPGEVFAIVVLSQLSFLLAAFMHRALAPEEDLQGTSFWAGLVERYSTSDVFGYATGVLGSAAVFFLLRYRLLAKSPRMALTGILLPVIVIAVSALLPTIDAVNDGEPNSFVSGFAISIFLVLVASWLIALVEQRNLEHQDFDVEGKRSQVDLQRAAKGKIE